MLLLKTDQIKKVDGGLLLANPYHDQKGQFTERHRGVPKRITTRWLKANLPNLDPKDLAEVKSRLRSVNSGARLAVVEQEEQRRAPKVDIPLDFLQRANVHEYAKTINSLMEQLVGFKSGWNGEIKNDRTMFTAGAKMLGCSIHMGDATMLDHTYGMDVLSHELTHGFSMASLKEEDHDRWIDAYMEDPKWEEGVVQGYHPILRRKVFDELRRQQSGFVGDPDMQEHVFPKDAVYEVMDLTNEYVPYVEFHRQMAENLDMGWEEYLNEIIRVPMWQRPKYTYTLANEKVRDGMIDEDAFSWVQGAYDDHLEKMSRL